MAGAAKTIGTGNEVLVYGAAVTVVLTILIAGSYYYLSSHPNLFGPGENATAEGIISGTVLIGPQCPVVRPDMEEQCKDNPYSAEIIVKTEKGRWEITRVRSDSNGKFRVALQAGEYILDPVSGGEIYPRASPQSVSVEPEKTTEVTIMYDTGIR